jgi:hypothetical protein
MPAGLPVSVRSERVTKKVELLGPNIPTSTTCSPVGALCAASARNSAARRRLGVNAAVMHTVADTAYDLASRSPRISISLRSHKKSSMRHLPQEQKPI